MDREGDILSHDKKVRDSDASENEVDGVVSLVLVYMFLYYTILQILSKQDTHLVSEDDDVEEIGDYAKATDDQREIAMDRLVHVLEQLFILFHFIIITVVVCI